MEKKKINHLNHHGLVNSGYRWLKKRCGAMFKELTSVTVEVPDVIGFNSNGSFLLEAKASRADFLADRKKPFRKDPSKGMGDWRFYIVPEGMVRIEELPEMWGLLEVNSRGTARISHNPFGRGNIYSLWKRNLKNEVAERDVMYSALRRLQQKGWLEKLIEKE